MAMIECPGCGEMISDKSKKCIHCGYLLVEEKPVICPECGAELSNGESICPKCGYPIEEEKSANTNTAPQQVEVTGVKVDQKSKKTLVIAAAIIVALIVGIFGVRAIQKQQAIQKAEQEAQEYKQKISATTSMILAGASEAESCGNLIKKVWYNAIYDERDTETDPYTRPNNYFVDFNTALTNLFIDPDFAKKIDSIQDNQTLVQEMMKELKNPPEGLKESYTAISELYDAYLKLTNLAVNPKGSLQTFSDDFNEADTETLNKYNAMELYIE